ncbi:MAG: hypothetical protein HY558_01545 [Euryarchaeota archaeon]|nr:hypothetical protein [Euryarchaeota archaeon]
MAEWLGKPNLREEDITPFFRRFPKYVQYYVEGRWPRIIVRIPPTHLDRFRKAIEKTEGKFSAGNANKAVTRAVLQWIEQNGK